ncbi:MAG: NAD(P)/FAD-dependent oxidoreductase, partial [Gemmatimonadetes bacterium]|nr:NAD(P)/FAD-dependent oxidoreductase [Gemmatimonadota bacterium]
LLRPIEQWGRRHLERTIPDPELRRRVTPDYTMGCKRTLLSNEYLPALARPNVEVVTDRLTEVREHSVVTADGREREVDAILFATGFQTMDMTSPVRFVGVDGVSLDERWKEGPQGYYGVAVTGYPNLFFIIGPNSRVANNSIVFMIEAQVGHILRLLDHMDARGARVLEVEPEAQSAYNDALQERMQRTVFVSGCDNWYRDARGRNPVLWPAFATGYWLKSRRVPSHGYRTLEGTAAES